MVRPDGKIVLVTGQGEGRRAILRISPAWLLETRRDHDFRIALNYAYIKAAILRSAAIEDAWPCNTRHTDREINGLDLSKTWSEALGP